MLTSKNKMYLRKLANHIKPVFQIGYEGINDNMIRDILAYLNKHELMKIKLLETCPLEIHEVSNRFLLEDIEIVQIIGRTFVIYKESLNADEKIEFPKR